MRVRADHGRPASGQGGGNLRTPSGSSTSNQQMKFGNLALVRCTPHEATVLYDTVNEQLGIM